MNIKISKIDITDNQRIGLRLTKPWQQKVKNAAKNSDSFRHDGYQHPTLLVSGRVVSEVGRRHISVIYHLRLCGSFYRYPRTDYL